MPVWLGQCWSSQAEELHGLMQNASWKSIGMALNGQQTEMSSASKSISAKTDFMPRGKSTAGTCQVVVGNFLMLNMADDMMVHDGLSTDEKWS